MVTDIGLGGLFICSGLSASGLSKISYAAAAVIRGFKQGGGSRLFQPVVTVRDTGSVGHGGEGGGERREPCGSFLWSLRMKAVSASGLSKISYAAAAVGRGFDRGSGSRLFQPWVWGVGCGVMGDGCDVELY